uniref:Putative deoxyribonuclease TATDN2 n=1 Tax=Magallana gigas TaxID=29159 RepID=K1QU86_MAGGI
MDVHFRCIHILQRMCDPDQPIHLHCFTGNQELVKLWIDRFSNVYFGFTGAVESFSVISGLRTVPVNRVLLNPDSPYMKPGGGYINIPVFIKDVASQVASRLKVTIKYLLWETVRNGHRLYKIKPLT